MHPRLIRAPGSYAVFGGAARVLVSENGRGISYGLTVGQWGAASPTEFDPTSGWFIHPSNSTDTWIFDGNDDLRRLQWIAGELFVQSSRTDPRLLEKAPTLVASHVRAERRKVVA